MAKRDPINYSTYIRAEKIIDKLTVTEDELFRGILQDYDVNRNHSWFPKTIIKLQEGPPNKIYTK